MPQIFDSCIWYKDEATYLRFREIIDDKEQLAGSYEGWVKMVQNQINTLAAKGIYIVKIKADPDEFLKWCKVEGYRPNAQARALFSSFKASQGIGEG